ncbi:putative ATPase family AAA domain-containing protein 3B [Triangularia verruculosa]|uniref:ATPase family AAA domain-containing protein 3B n=1 Tax=Triangularia verruculosa TaxID=2587418 RepID=A0AAN6X962_9PEZI|nr:putative ATPase family AAA domain-containing protein 3B [Triangularia verruculosa]
MDTVEDVNYASSVASFEDIGRPLASRDESTGILYTTINMTDGKITNIHHHHPPRPPEFNPHNRNTTITTPSRQYEQQNRPTYRPPNSLGEFSDNDDDNEMPPPELIPSMMGSCGSGSGGYVKREMVVHSEYLRAALRAVVGYYPGFEGISRGEEVLKIAAPYLVLVHHWEELEAYKTAQLSCHAATTGGGHIDLLFNFLTGLYGEGLEQEKKRWAEGRATYDYFYHLLKPGSVVYRSVGSENTAYVVSGINFLSSSARQMEPTTTTTGEIYGQQGMLVYMWNLTYRKGVMKRVMIQRVVYPWDGEREIGSLPVVPGRWVGYKVRERMVDRGRMYWALAGVGVYYREYEGYLGGEKGRRAGLITGKVIVDPEGYERFAEQAPNARNRFMCTPPKMWDERTNPAREDRLPQVKGMCGCESCKGGQKEEKSEWAGWDNLDPKAGKLPEKEEEYFRVIGPLIPGFVVRERRWAHLHISGLSEIKDDSDAFKHLVLDPEVKLTIKAMMSKFSSSSNKNGKGNLHPWPSDIIPDKGLGRIFLLHGSPGVGKTLTAECSALLTRRPLLSLTSGDISPSFSPPEVETSLQYYLTLGERFGALVLIDEADVYLERRQTKDLRRNGLVSVFLRALEYYRGVLILTTNRAESFDDAFTSRIHVALHYRELDAEQRGGIWEVGFDRLERESKGGVVVGREVREWVRRKGGLEWNGREIRNGLQTAVALAEFEATERGLKGTIEVRVEDLEVVEGLRRGFRDFLGGKRKGGGEGDEQRKKRVRRDEDEEMEDDVEEEEEEETADPTQKLPINHPLRRDEYRSQLLLLEQQSVRTQWYLKLLTAKRSPSFLNGCVHDNWEKHP